MQFISISSTSPVTQAFHTFNNNILSAFYFDVVKDRLYNDAKQGTNRRNAQTVLFRVSVTSCCFPCYSRLLLCSISKLPIWYVHWLSLRHKSLQILNDYTITLAPIACHTAEEIYEHFKDMTLAPKPSVFRVGWPRLVSTRSGLAHQKQKVILELFWINNVLIIIIIIII